MHAVGSAERKKERKKGTNKQKADNKNPEQLPDRDQLVYYIFGHSGFGNFGFGQLF